jgi:hypothetical protein
MEITENLQSFAKKQFIKLCKFTDKLLAASHNN